MQDQRETALVFSMSDKATGRGAGSLCWWDHQVGGQGTVPAYQKPWWQEWPGEVGLHLLGGVRVCWEGGAARTCSPDPLPTVAGDEGLGRNKFSLQGRSHLLPYHDP